MPRFVFVLASSLLAASLAACGSGEIVQETPFAVSERALHDHLDRLTGSVAGTDSAQVGRRVIYAADQMRAAGLMPVFASSFFLTGAATDPAGAHVLGYVPGRNPNYADTLVVVAADVDRPGAAAALETARRLALEALDTQVPAHTVLIALWVPPRTGAQGLADYLAHPTWGLDQIERILLVTPDSAAADESRALLEPHGVALEVMDVSAITSQPDRPRSERAQLRAETLQLAEALYARTRMLSVPDGAALDSTLRPFQPIGQ